MPELATLIVSAVASVAAAVVVHELGHLLAAGAFGASKLRLRAGWPAVRVEADLPDEPGAVVVFLTAGAVANVGAAAALWGFGGLFALAAIFQLLMAASALLPVGNSDGAQLWRHCTGKRDRRQRDGV